MNASPSNKLPSLTLVLGGQRSGKSAYGESLLPGGGVYVATADAHQSVGDAEMTARIEAHRTRRGPDWQTIEAPFDLSGALSGAPENKDVLIDSLGMWVANRLEQEFDATREGDALATMLLAHPAPVVVISEQTGLGVIPENALARKFVDVLGALNQSVATHANRVVLVTAGLPMILKGEQ